MDLPACFINEFLFDYELEFAREELFFEVVELLVFVRAAEVEHGEAPVTAVACGTDSDCRGFHT